MLMIAPIRLQETWMSDDTTRTIRELNDRFRTKLDGGRLIFAGDLARAAETVLKRALAEAMQFTAFSAANDPEGKHDFGDFILDGRHTFWKIDYYDLAMEGGSEDPADPTLTTRVLTISYAEDFEGDE
jgi:hypothetical protein